MEPPTETTIPTDGRRPSGLPHLPEATHSFDAINTLFKNRRVGPATGHVLEDEKPFYKPGRHSQTYLVGKGHKVTSNFTDAERAYVKTTITYLNLMANGLFFGASDQAPKTLAERIVESYTREKDKPEPSYNRALIEATYSLLEEFSERYPNLLPVLNALMQGEGGVGIGIALFRRTGDLGEAISGSLTRDNIGDVDSPSQKDFVGLHNNYDDTGTTLYGTYERWCSGQALTRTISQQSREAALRISESGNTGNYSKNADGFMFGRGDFVGKVSELYRKTSRAADKAA